MSWVKGHWRGLKRVRGHYRRPSALSWFAVLGAAAESLPTVLPSSPVRRTISLVAVAVILTMGGLCMFTSAARTNRQLATAAAPPPPVRLSRAPFAPLPGVQRAEAARAAVPSTAAPDPADTPATGRHRHSSRRHHR